MVQSLSILCWPGLVTRSWEKVSILLGVLLPQKLVSLVGLAVVRPDLQWRLERRRRVSRLTLKNSDRSWSRGSRAFRLLSISTRSSVLFFSNFIIFNPNLDLASDKKIYSGVFTWLARILGPVSDVSSPLAETNSRLARALIGSIGTCAGGSRVYTIPSSSTFFSCAGAGAVFGLFVETFASLLTRAKLWDGSCHFHLGSSSCLSSSISLPWGDL